MKISKRQLRKLVREVHHGEDEWYTDQDETFADYLFRVNQEQDELDAEELGGVHDEFEEEEIEPLRQRDQRLAASPRRSGMGRRHEGTIKVTKRQLLNIIKEEKEKLAAGHQFVDSHDANDPADHHWPRIENNDVSSLVNQWEKLELDSYDPDVMPVKGASDREKRDHWGSSCGAAALDLETALAEKIRNAALEAMKEYSGKLMNGDYK